MKVVRRAIYAVMMAVTFAGSVGPAIAQQAVTVVNTPTVTANLGTIGGASTASNQATENRVTGDYRDGCPRSNPGLRRNALHEQNREHLPAKPVPGWGCSDHGIGDRDDGGHDRHPGRNNR